MPASNDSSADRDPLDRLAEEFVARYRAGEMPSLTEYANRLPDRADSARTLSRPGRDGATQAGLR